jgi:hypothetical protein
MLLYTRNLTSKVPVHIFLLENIVKLRFRGPSEAEGPQQQPKAIPVHRSLIGRLLCTDTPSTRAFC